MTKPQWSDIWKTPSKYSSELISLIEGGPIYKSLGFHFKMENTTQGAVHTKLCKAVMNSWREMVPVDFDPVEDHICWHCRYLK